MKTLSILLTGLILFLVYYFGMPTFAFGFFGIPITVLIISLLLRAGFGYNIGQQRWIWHPVSKVAEIFAILTLLYILFVPALVSLPIIHAGKYQRLIGEVSEGNFSSDLAPISNDKIRIVDQDVAKRLGDKVLGEVPALGSQTQIGNFNIQAVNGKLYWIAPLLHSGYFKWSSNNGTPGYVMVSATNESDVRLVQNVNGKDLHIIYQPNAFFGEYLERHLYTSGYRSVGKTDYTFEIDDEGNPYWVVTLYRKTIGFGGSDAYGVAVVDAQTGAITEYSISDAPIWIDRIQPEDFVTNQLESWGEYVHGWWNFQQLDMLTPTPGMSLVYGEDDRSYWYTGITSVGSDEGTVGFVLVDTRTKATKWYKQPGATETAAMGSAQGKVQEKEYAATFPVTYNINGVPTYVMSLKDNGGLIKMIAMVSVHNYGLVGVGDNLTTTLRNYKAALNSKGNALSPTADVERYQTTSKVVRWSEDVSDGNTYYYFTVDKYKNKLFVTTSDVSPEVPITKTGDRVTILYDDSRNAVIDLVTFDNLEIVLQKTDEQIEKEQYFASVDSTSYTGDALKNADNLFENLPDSVKLKMMQDVKQNK